ncbi:MAG: MarR family transcriptional regulator [Clostridia bacterium]|nr:MarR family transcriptional regulator [Clostridia bacterium]
MHGMILKFISICMGLEHEVYQKDIEAEFDIARSTVTATLKLMEKKGYIRREGVAHDARLKKILLTTFGEEALARIDTSIQQAEALMRSAFTEREYQEFMQLLDRVKSVL